MFYHLGKTNVIADALNRKSSVELACVMAHLWVQPVLSDQVKTTQKSDPHTLRIVEEVIKGLKKDFTLQDDGSLWYGKRLSVPNDSAFKEETMKDAHCSSYLVHPGSTKMYKGLKEQFWWNNMKQEIAKLVSRCLTCQMVKIEYQKPVGLLHSMDISEWKWEYIGMDFVSSLLKTKMGFNSIWVPKLVATLKH